MVGEVVLGGFLGHCLVEQVKIGLVGGHLELVVLFDGVYIRLHIVYGLYCSCAILCYGGPLCQLIVLVGFLC
jgi:hypothetical protein